MLTGCKGLKKLRDMQIMLPHGKRNELATDFGVSRTTLWKALTGQSDTPVAKKLRKAAIERGGVEFDPDRKKRTN